MKCSKCGSDIPENSRFCLSCGEPVADQNPDSAPYQQNAYQNQYQNQNQNTYPPAYTYQNQYRTAPAPKPVYADPAERAAASSVLTFGILAIAFACTFFLSPVGIIFATIGMNKARNYANAYGMLSGKTKVGKILSTVALPVSIVLSVLLIFYIAIIADIINSAGRSSSRKYYYDSFMSVKDYIKYL